MLDIQFIRDNPKVVAEKSKQKGCKVDIDKLLALDAEIRQIQPNLEKAQQERNELAAQFKKQKPTPAQIEEGRKFRDKVSQLEAHLDDIKQSYLKLLKAVPNMPLDDVLVGASEEENVAVKTVGKPKELDFTPLHDHELGAKHDLIDKERAAKIAGSRFAYLKGNLVRMQFALIQFVMKTLGDEKVIEKLVKDNNLDISTKPFVPILPPAMLRTEPYTASSRLNAEEVTYKLADDDLWLNASAEHTLCTMYWNEILPEEMFPIRYLGYSTSFRREAGTYGKDTEGIFRLHQFDKLEMEVFATPETGLHEHLLQVAIQEHLMQQLELPYQVIQKCTFDIGKPNARGVDIDTWMPGQGKYRETHTADYITDYQSRDLKIRVKRANGDTQLVHTCDATAFAMSRILKAIIENYQTKDGNIDIPKVLKPYM
jgi:seryl-tRNA synthetase